MSELLIAIFKEIDARHEILTNTLFNSEEASSGHLFTIAIGPVFWEQVEELRQQIVLAGEILEDPSERRRAQNILDFWSTELINATSAIEEPVRRLQLLPQKMPDGIESPEINLSDEESRELIRYSAAARLWLSNDKHESYLLSGEALERAMTIADHDPDVAKLVQNSQNAQLVKQKYRNRELVSAISGLVILAAGALAGAYYSYTKSQETEILAMDALAAVKRANAKSAELELNNLQNLERMEKLEKQQREFGEYIGLIRTAVYECKLDPAGLSERVQEQVFGAAADQLATIQPHVKTVFGRCSGEIKNPIIDKVDEANLELPKLALKQLKGRQFNHDPLSVWSFNGYDDRFLGPIIPLPKFVGNLKKSNRTIDTETQKLTYPNFTIVMDPQRRMALYSASNVDRTLVRILRRGQSKFLNDPRLSASQQLDLKWFKDNPLDRGHLVTRTEITWGDNFSKNDTTASSQAAGFVNRATNLVPQYEMVNQGVWRELERYVLNEFDASAGKLTVFSGPVFSRKNTGIAFGNTVVPDAFWKIVVSNSVGAEIKAEAYLIDNKEEGVEKFSKSAHQVPVSKIEFLTGLSFPDIIPSSDAFTYDAQQTKSLVPELGLTTDPDQTPPSPKQLATLEGIAGNVKAAEFNKMPVDDIDEFLARISRIPAKTWTSHDWRFEAANIRKVLINLDIRISNKELALDGESQTRFGKLKAATGLDNQPSQIIYFQFAGMTRKLAVEISDQLKQLGWDIPGEERTGKAATYNEVRYGSEADREAAERLAADLNAIDSISICCVKKNSSIKKGIIEVWVSI